MRWKPPQWDLTKLRLPRPWIRSCQACEESFFLEAHWGGVWHVTGYKRPWWSWRYLCTTCCPSFEDADATYRATKRLKVAA